jgi:hypothetical protein
MPPPLPDRYRLEIRLGRDGDIEEWLATDTNLDRPVLLRVMGPDATPSRRLQFLAGVTQAAGVSHQHLQQVYAAEEVVDGAYAACEWVGGVTLAGRLQAGDTIDPLEFIPNASGLAGALAALHQAGVAHGGIDLAAVFYSVAHPAKLGGFGRPSADATVAGDVVDLSNLLEHALTGFEPGGPPPSQVVDGLPVEIDHVLARGRSGRLTARALAEELASAPNPSPPSTEPEAVPVRGLRLSAALVALAAGLVLVGRLLAAPGAPSVFPIIPTTTPASVAAIVTTTSTAARAAGAVTILSAATFDPFGEGGENDDKVGLIIDGDVGTSWRTERYLDPLPLLKPGVGVTVEVAGAPDQIELVGLTAGSVFRLLWSPGRPAVPDEWEVVLEARAGEGPVELRIPARSGGYWLIWLTDLPPASEGYLATLAEVRFPS